MERRQKRCETIAPLVLGSVVLMADAVDKRDKGVIATNAFKDQLPPGIGTTVGPAKAVVALGQLVAQGMGPRNFVDCS